LDQLNRDDLGSLTPLSYFGGGVVVLLPFLPFLPPLWPFLPPFFLELVFEALLELISPPAGWEMESAAKVLTGELPGATPGPAAVDPKKASNTYSTNAMFGSLSIL
jgi:hypothetical protein